MYNTFKKIPKILKITMSLHVFNKLVTEIVLNNSETSWN